MKQDVFKKYLAAADRGETKLSEIRHSIGTRLFGRMNLEPGITRSQAMWPVATGRYPVLDHCLPVQVFRDIERKIIRNGPVLELSRSQYDLKSKFPLKPGNYVLRPVRICLHPPPFTKLKLFCSRYEGFEELGCLRGPQVISVRTLPQKAAPFF